MIQLSNMVVVLMMKRSTKKNSHTYGSNGKDPFEVLDEIREKLIDVDAAIIQDLSDLFMGLY